VIDLTNLATEIDSKFKDLEEILSKIDVMSSKKRDELIKKLEELTEWKQVMK
jgi:predicted HAD superfamily phosphohydrolase